MPTPFYHLSLAYELLEHPELSPQVRTSLQSHYSEFMLGKTAPDVQSITGQRREATHFFTLPPEDTTPAYQRMWAVHPDIKQAAGLPPQQAVFLAGYICHLQADESWIFEILPYFLAEGIGGNDVRQRIYLHNILRAYLDHQTLTSLPSDAGERLEEADPQSWLPFAKDEELAEWRDYLAEQLQPGAVVRTVEVFAKRQDIPVEEFQALLHDEGRLKTEIFAYLPREKLTEYRQNLIAKNIKLLHTFLGEHPTEAENP